MIRAMDGATGMTAQQLNVGDRQQPGNVSTGSTFKRSRAEFRRLLYRFNAPGTNASERPACVFPVGVRFRRRPSRYH